MNGYIRKGRNQMGIVYKKLTENELSRITKMRIDQLTEEYTLSGKTPPENVDLEIAIAKLEAEN